jgi:NTE family protein
VLPDGSLDLAQHATAIERVLGADWPNDELWLCTVRQSDLRRVVIGRDVWAPLSTAVCASCAIPGYFRPVDIGGRPHIDGGVRSPTNAMCCGDTMSTWPSSCRPCPAAISACSGPATSYAAELAGRCTRSATACRRAGIPSVLAEPGPDAVDVLGIDFMSHANLRDIVRAAFFDTGEQLRAPIARTPPRRAEQPDTARMPSPHARRTRARVVPNGDGRQVRGRDTAPQQGPHQ